MRKAAQKIVCALLLVVLCTTALAQRNTFTTRIPAAIASGEFAEARVLIEEAVKIGVITSAAASQYRAQIQVQERARQQTQELSSGTPQIKPPQAADVSPSPHSITQPSPKEKLGPDVLPLPYEPDPEQDKHEVKRGRIYVRCWNCYKLQRQVPGSRLLEGSRKRAAVD
ncbi:MAG TPA: hypothetical protein VF815_42075 [Myxococcaceae bacterium]